jgi:hypothetical protein
MPLRGAESPQKLAQPMGALKVTLKVRKRHRTGFSGASSARSWRTGLIQLQRDLVRTLSSSSSGRGTKNNTPKLTLAKLHMLSSGLLPTPALETFVKRIDRSKSQFGGGVYVGDTGL